MRWVVREGGIRVKLHVGAEKVYANQMTGFVQIRSILGKNSFCIPITIYCSIFLSHGDSNVIKASHFTNLGLFLGVMTDGQAEMSWA